MPSIIIVPSGPVVPVVRTLFPASNTWNTLPLNPCLVVVSVMFTLKLILLYVLLTIVVLIVKSRIVTDTSLNPSDVLLDEYLSVPS